MSDYLSMNADAVRQQADAFHTAASALTSAANSWVGMFDSKDLGAHYTDEAGKIVEGFTAVTGVVKNWSDACTSFGDALAYAANTVQSSDDQFSSDIAKVSFNDSGNLTGGK